MFALLLLLNFVECLENEVEKKNASKPPSFLLPAVSTALRYLSCLLTGSASGCFRMPSLPELRSFLPGALQCMLILSANAIGSAFLVELVLVIKRNRSVDFIHIPFNFVFLLIFFPIRIRH